MSTTASTLTIIGSLTAVIGFLQFNINQRFNQIEARLMRIEDTFLKDYSERIVRLEERLGALSP